jgi:hypothetical protein
VPYPLLSDLHGEAGALEAVLAELRRAAIEWEDERLEAWLAS